MPETLEVQTDGAVMTVTINRPEVHNAMNDLMASEFITIFEAMRDDRSIRAVVIRAAGETYSAGGDLGDMKRHAEMSHDERVANMMRFDMMLRAVNEAPQVTVAQVQGSALGGGFGLVCCADVAIASEKARFGLPEVRLGLSPALISPYVIARIGLTRARALMLTGGHMNASEALAAGVVHEVCEPDQLETQVQAVVQHILQCAPHALAETKKLIFHVMSHSLDESLPYRAELITRLRYGEEGQEGMQAFMEKRKPSWAS